jgi:hypothetical protein
MRLAVALSVLLVTTAIAQRMPQQLVGIWHSVSATTRDGRDITPRRGGLELEFGRDGSLVQTVVSPAHAGEEPLRYRGSYTFDPPDKITYTYTRGGDENTQHQRFEINGDVATFENLDSGIITRMRRIQKSEFENPHDISEIPK